ncbi:MAG TPA: SpvB/TcaC N-terminal domain-containing protein [Pseudomonas sp.]|uniref:SpvB/TcaC N-terminal domain-containing protein n=1 Tax=Pseudomonas sp. TaxID=306 RepID=UPI002C3C29BD|nr:SpvB/TcaC N-terminal domain-containing protein [Pseudomonas sp.]HWH86970.1 SpvB/TcaC N-terminal domain-containing protein [Pseudomonas sp.]
MAEQELSIVTPSIAKSSTIATIGKSWGAVGPTGAASFVLPIPASSGRGWDPQLSLTYSSQTGNGPFGIGWALNAGQISLRTNKGVPRYDGHDEVVGSDGEVWMPELLADGSLDSRLETTYQGENIGPHSVVRYWARVEGDFALREYWQRPSRLKEASPPGFWLIHGADGSLHVYGKTANARLTDPDDAQRISAWLLSESMNTHGKHICYQYKADDQDPDPIHDYRAQRYLERVYYGNCTASEKLYAWDDADPAQWGWLFHLLFDYGERTTSLTEVPVYDGATLQPWIDRPDRFSTYGQGFALGTRRLCQQVLMFHHFPASEDDPPKLVRRLLLEYHTAPDRSQWAFGQIAAAHYQAFDASGFVENTPPVEFDYAPFELNKTPSRLFESQTQPGIEDGGSYQCVDLYGEGLPGFLCRYDQSWYYREPLRGTPQTDEIDYGPWTPLERIPVADRSRGTEQLLTDLTGDGRLDWITAQPGLSGFRTLNAQREFSDFVAFNKFPLEFFNTLSTLGDLSGDGLSSVAMIGPHSVRLYANRREEGFAAAEEVSHQPDDDRLPVFSDTPTELVLLGQMLGSDMPELSRIRHDAITCWPNLGHGKFGRGRKISDLPFSYEQFDASRVRLADLDGSGASALIYLKSDVFEIYLNRGGNGLEQIPLTVPWPTGVRYDRLCQVTFADLQGLGCASLILTVPYMQPQHWRYDFVSAKPYLLTSSNNNMGCSASVVYRSSAQEWLDEKQRMLTLKRLPVSHLPFPVAVVKKQQQLDEITGNCLTQTFTWREGVYDGVDREFRGFGHLQQTDSESATGDDDAGFSAPVRVCTWFHTGQSMDRPRDQYFNADKDAVALGKTLFSRTPPEEEFDQPIAPHDADTEYQIRRALVGAVARVETYADADKDLPGIATPFAVQESRYLVREVRPQGHYADAVLLPLVLEEISYQYDGFVDDPLCSHQVNLRWNRYGLSTQALTVSYARRLNEGDTPPFTDPDEQQWWRDAHDEAQQSFYLSESRAQYIDLLDLQQWRLGLPYLARSNALVLPKGTLPTGLSPAQVSYEQLALHQDSSQWRNARLLTSQSVQRYVKPDGSPLPDGKAGFEALKGPLELAQLDKTALQAYSVLPKPFDIHIELSKIGYTPMAFLFEPPAPADAEPELYSSCFGFAEYADLNGFYRVQRYHETPSHGVTEAEYDGYGLALTRVTLPDGCTTRIAYDYHALQPLQIINANENIEEAIYEPSGQPLATSFHGTENGVVAGFRPLSEYKRPEDHRPDPAIADPESAVQNAASTLRKDLFSWMGEVTAPAALSAQWVADRYLLPSGHIRASARQRLARRTSLTPSEQALLEAIQTTRREPVHSVVLSADRYHDDEIPAQIQIIKACVDGFGRALQTQQRVDPGMAYAVDDDGSLIIENGQLKEVFAESRWRTSARVEYNNKGAEVRAFRPIFTEDHRYIKDESLREYGFFDQLFYDALGRLIKLINAKGYFSRTAYHPWYQTAEDFNDTIKPPTETSTR